MEPLYYSLAFSECFNCSSTTACAMSDATPAKLIACWFECVPAETGVWSCLFKLRAKERGVYARGVWTVCPWCPLVPWAVLGVCVKHLLKGADSFKPCCARTGLADCHCRTAIAVPVEFAKQLTAIMAVINL